MNGSKTAKSIKRATPVKRRAVSVKAEEKSLDVSQSVAFINTAPFASRRVAGDYQLLFEYQTNGVVYACANINAKGVASTDYRLYSKSSKRAIEKRNNKAVAVTQWEETEDHPLLALLSNANDSLNGYQLFALTSIYLDVLGKSYWLIDRNPLSDEPDRIWLLMPQCVTPVFDADGVLIEYKYRVGRNAAQTYAKEDVIDFRLPALDNPYSGGMSPLATVYSQVTIAGKLTDYVNNVLDNRARPEALLIPKGDPSDDVAKRALAKFNNRVSGKGNGGTVVLDGQYEYHPLTYPPTDLAALEIDEHTRRVVCNAFGVPEAMLSKDANRANADAAAYQLAKWSTLPRVREIQQKINDKLLPMFGEDATATLFFEFDNPVPADNEFELKKAAEQNKALPIAVSAGVVRWNELREKAGLPPDEGRDEEYVIPPQPSKPQPAASEDAPAAKAAEVEQQPQGIDVEALLKISAAVRKGELPRAAAISIVAKLLDAEEADIRHLVAEAPKEAPAAQPSPCACCAKNAPQKAEQKAQRATGEAAAAEQLQAKLAAFFRRLKAEALDQVEKSADDADALLANLQSLYATKADTGRLPKQFVKLERWANELRGKADDLAYEVKPVIELSVKQTAEGKVDAMVRAGALPDAFSVLPQKVNEAADARAFAFADSTLKTTSKTLTTAIEGVKDRVLAGLLEGDSVAELRRSVSEVFENAEEFQAERIARTEASAAVHSGQVIAAKASGIVKGFKYLVSSDACPLCQAYAGKTINLKDYDDSGAVDAEGVVPLHPSCTCTLLEVLNDE